MDLPTPSAMVREALELLDSGSVARWLDDPDLMVGLEPYRQVYLLAAKDMVHRARQRLRQACALLPQT